MSKPIPDKAMTMRLLVTMAAAALACATPAGAQGTPRFLLACAPCHGFDGTGRDPETPNLGGQSAVYLYKQMMAFRTAERQHPEMNFFAGQMTRDEMRAIAEYYSKLVK
jgi:cytochrome c553